MGNWFHDELDALNTHLLEMGSMIEYAIETGVQAMEQRNAELARTIVSYDREIDQKEREIESQCLKLLLRQHPVARDLRFISAALKMVTDMERIADNAADIAEISLTADVSTIMHIVKEIQTMSEKVIIMVSHSIDSFVTTDMTLANETIKADDEVDELFISIRNRIVELIKSEHCSGEVAVDALMIVKYLERIADHAVNICEWVEFFKTGEYKNTRII